MSAEAHGFRLSPAAGLFLARAVRAPLWLFVSALLARVLSPQGLGTWAMVLAAAMLGNQLFLLWTQSITQRFGRAEWLERGSFDNTWAARWPSLGTGLLIALVLVAAAPFDWPARHYGLEGDLRWLILPALLTLLLMGEAQGLQQVRERYTVLAWSPVVADLSLLLVIAALALARVAGHLPAMPVVLALLASTGLLVWLAFLARELRGLTVRWRLPSPMAWRQATLFALPLVPGFAVGYLAEWCDYILIGHFYDAGSVGLFHPAYQYMLLLVGIPTAIASALLPQVVTAMDKGGETGLRSLVTRMAPQLIVLWSVASLPVVAVLPLVFGRLTGEAYASSRDVLCILLIAVPGAISSHIYTLAHFAQGRLMTANLGLFGLKLMVNVAVSFVLLPRLGIVGSAIGCAVSYLVLQWLFLADQHRHLGLAPGAGALALLLAHLSAVAMGLLPDNAWRLAAALPLALVPLAWARQAGLFSPDEVSAMMPHRLIRLAPFVTRALCRTCA